MKDKRPEGHCICLRW